MPDENKLTPAEDIGTILREIEQHQAEPTPVENAVKSKPAVNVLDIAAKGVLGAAVGVAGGMLLVSFAAAVGGAVLSWAAFAQVLGIAGAAGGVSHGVMTQTNRKKR